jgi:hypothetical protein
MKLLWIILTVALVAIVVGLLAWLGHMPPARVVMRLASSPTWPPRPDSRDSGFRSRAAAPAEARGSPGPSRPRILCGLRINQTAPRCKVMEPPRQVRPRKVDLGVTQGEWLYSAREYVSSFGAAARRLRQRVPLRSGLAASERAVMRVALGLSASFLLTFFTAPALAADPSVSAGVCP